MSTTTNVDTDAAINPTELPPRIQRHHSSDDPWYEYDGESLFEDEELARAIVARLLSRRNIGRYSPRGAYRKSTKIQTKDVDAFKDELRAAFESAGESLGFATVSLSEIDIHDDRPRKTLVYFDPSFGRSAFMNGASQARQDVLLEMKRYEVERFWEEVAEPVFDKYNERYPY